MFSLFQLQSTPVKIRNDLVTYCIAEIDRLFVIRFVEPGLNSSFVWKRVLHSSG